MLKMKENYHKPSGPYEVETKEQDTGCGVVPT